MDIQAYIESGILEEYCAGLLSTNEQAKLIKMSMLYPEIKLELNAIELALEQLAALNAIMPVASLKPQIFKALGFQDDGAKLDLNNLPATNKYSNHYHWLNTLAHLIPEIPAEDFLAEVLRHDEQIAQLLVITKNDVPEETHGDLIESFFILKGKCECTVGDHLYKLSPGDFLEIPLHVEHDIKIVSPYVVGILQHRFI